MGLGIGIVLTIIIVSLIVAGKGSRFSLGQAVYYMFIGLLLASLAPSLPVTMNNMVTQTSNSIQHINTHK